MKEMVHHSFKLKRDYSRGGCRECKRRKIKCDEQKPECSKCIKLSKPCSYPSVGEKVLRVSKKFMSSNSDTSLSIDQYSPTKKKRRKTGDNEEIKLDTEQYDDTTLLSAVSSNTTSTHTDYTPRSTHRDILPGFNGLFNQQNGVYSTSYRESDHNNHRYLGGLLSDLGDIPNRLPVYPDLPVISRSNHGSLFSPAQSDSRNLLENVKNPATLRDSNLLENGSTNSGGMNNVGVDSVGSNGLNGGQNNGLIGPNRRLSNGMNAPNRVSNSGVNESINNENLNSGSINLGNINNESMNGGIPTNNLPLISSFDQGNGINKSYEGLINSINQDSKDLSIDMLDIFSQQDLDVLATDLNLIVTDIMNHPLSSDNYVPKASPYTNSIPHEIMSFITPDELIYLESFWNDFAMQIMPFGSYDAYTRTYQNPIRDTLLKYACREPFLLAAILAQGAKLTYTNQLKHQQAYCNYLSKCLSLLGPALSQNQQKKVRNDLVDNIESILLTVLLLASANATINTEWRPHLKGAKDIILKATNSKIRQSKTLILCKAWFIDFEILAGTSSSIGGTLTTDFELNSTIFFSNYELSILRESKILQPNGFCLMFGYNIECIDLFRELIKIFNRKRLQGDKFVANDSFDYINLISNFNRLYNQSYINRECELPETYINNSSIDMLPDLIDVVHDGFGNQKTVISIMDLCQQCYCLAGMTVIFTQVLQVPSELAFVQIFVKKLIGLVSFVSKYDSLPKQSIRHTFLMIQWPLSIAGLYCTDIDQRAVVLKFFKFSAELGSFSSNHTLKRLNKLWLARDNGQEIDDEVEQDVVAY